MLGGDRTHTAASRLARGSQHDPHSCRESTQVDDAKVHDCAFVLMLDDAAFVEVSVGAKLEASERNRGAALVDQSREFAHIAHRVHLLSYPIFPIFVY